MKIIFTKDFKNYIFKFGFLFIAMFQLLPINIESYGVFILILIGLIQGFTRIKVDDLKLILFFCSFYLFEAFTLIYTQDYERGFNVILRGVTFLLMPLAFLLLKKVITKKVIEDFLTVFLISLVILVLILGVSLVNFFELYSFKLIILAIESWKFKYVLLNDFYKDLHPTYLSMAFLLGVFILFLRIREGKKLMKNLLYFVTIFFFTLTIFLLRSRIILISFIIITPIFLLLIYGVLNYRKLFYTTLTCFFLLIISYNFLSQNQITGLKKQFKNSLNINDKNVSRINIYSSSYDVIEKNLFLGVGTGDVKKELISSYKKNEFHQLYQYQFFNSHNQYLDYLLRGGIFLLLLFIGSFIFLLSKCLKTSDHLFFCFLLMIMLVMLTENIFNRINGIFFFSLFSSIFYYKNRMISKNLNEK